MRADGSEITPLTESEAQEWTPTWSPDSSRIAFFSDDEIVVMNADGSEASQLEIAHPASSPDWASGKRIFYTGDHETGAAEIHAINADGTGKTRLTRRAGEDQSPSVSPNGRRITYGRDYNLAIMRADGTRVRTIHKGRGERSTRDGATYTRRTGVARRAIEMMRCSTDRLWFVLGTKPASWSFSALLESHFSAV
jgi:Tol biopolymer transport system component